MIVHAGLIARRLGGEWRGVLIEGPSGVGKSDLALRCLDHGFRLVADDRVLLFRSGAALFGRAPAPIEGLIEARGVDVLREPWLAFCRIDLLVACGGEPERVPAMATEIRLEVPIRRLRLAALEPSAPAKLCRALEALGRGAQQD